MPLAYGVQYPPGHYSHLGAVVISVFGCSSLGMICNGQLLKGFMWFVLTACTMWATLNIALFLSFKMQTPAQQAAVLWSIITPVALAIWVVGLIDVIKIGDKLGRGQFVGPWEWF